MKLGIVRTPKKFSASLTEYTKDGRSERSAKNKGLPMGYHL